MAKIYAKKYLKMIESGEISFEQAIEMVNTDVPVRWRDSVISIMNSEHS